MKFLRLEEAPKEIAEETYKLVQQYFDQAENEGEVPDGADELPDKAIEKFLRAHGSRALAVYLDEVENAREEAAREGLL